MKKKILTTALMCSIGIACITFVPNHIETVHAYDFQYATINYDLNGAVFLDDAPTSIYKGCAFTIPIPVKVGCTFVDWYVTYSSNNDGVYYDAFIDGMTIDKVNNVCCYPADFDLFVTGPKFSSYEFTFRPSFDPNNEAVENLMTSDTLTSIGFEFDCFDKGWNLVTNLSQVRENELVAIVSKDYNYAMTNVVNGLRMDKDAISFENERNNIVESTLDSKGIFTLVKGTEEGSYALKTGSQYVISSGTDSNSMTLSNTLNSKCSFNLSINDEGRTIIEYLGGNNYKYLRFNIDNTYKFPHFRCSSTLEDYSDIQIYRYSYGLRKASLRFGSILSEQDYNNLTSLGTLGVEVSYTSGGYTYSKSVTFNEQSVAKVDSYGKAWTEGDVYYQFGMTINGVEKKIQQEFTGKVFITNGVSKCYMGKRRMSFYNAVWYYKCNDVYDYLNSEDQLLVDRLADMYGIRGDI